MTEPTTPAPPPALDAATASPPAGLEPPPPVPAARPRRRGLHLGPLPINLASVLVFLTLVGSTAFIAWVVLGTEERQIELLAYGFAVLGASFVAIALGSLVGMWRAASESRGGRALALAIFGGLAALAAIGCFTVSALSAMVWRS